MLNSGGNESRPYDQACCPRFVGEGFTPSRSRWALLGGLLAVPVEDVGDGADGGAGGAVFPGQPGQRPAGGLA